MKKYEDYLLITDMDGTLLNKKKEISADNMQAIKSFIEEGGNFAIATGRSPVSAKPWLNQLPINFPCVFYNGSMVKDVNENCVMDCACLEKEKFLPLVTWILEYHRDTVVEIFTEKGLYVVSAPEFKDPYLEQEQDPYIQADVKETEEQGWIKILLCNSHEKLEWVERRLQEAGLCDSCNHFYSQDFFLEITPRNHSKGTALDILRRHGRDGLKIIAVGDYENDMELISRADFGVAVGNAQEAVKAVADYVTVDHESGPMKDLLAWVFERE